jgi:hypothetical protein
MKVLTRFTGCESFPMFSTIVYFTKDAKEYTPKNETKISLNRWRATCSIYD